MSISLEKLMLHMAWANQQIYGQISELPNEALSAFVTNKEWAVSEILFHITRSANSYGCRLNGEKLQDIKAASNMGELVDLASKLKTFDSVLLELAKEPERIVEVNRDGVITHWQASTILSQSIHHATEHRAQAVAALEFRGFKAPNLDDYDLWAYERSTK
jgi:uncharacterized damage-inducible protein DinB